MDSALTVELSITQSAATCSRQLSKLKFIFLTFSPSRSSGRVRSPKGSTPLSPGTRLTVWYRGFLQHPRTASSVVQNPQPYSPCATHILAFSTTESDTFRGEIKTVRIRGEPNSQFNSLVVCCTVRPPERYAMSTLKITGCKEKRTLKKGTIIPGLTEE